MLVDRSVPPLRKWYSAYEDDHWLPQAGASMTEVCQRYETQWNHVAVSWTVFDSVRPTAEKNRVDMASLASAGQHSYSRASVSRVGSLQRLGDSLVLPGRTRKYPEDSPYSPRIEI